MAIHRKDLLYLALLCIAALIVGYSTSLKSPNSDLAEILHRPIRSLTFPEESTAGLFLALAIPLEDPYKSVSIANFFEATYDLPTNASEEYLWLNGLDERRRKKRSLDRVTLYQVVESKFVNHGYQGHECLLRAICETSEHSLRHNGLIGDILHVIFTPTSSRHEQLPQDILQAEVVGRNGSCSNYRPQCPVGLFDLIGVLGTKLYCDGLGKSHRFRLLQLNFPDHSVQRCIDYFENNHGGTFLMLINALLCARQNSPDLIRQITEGEPTNSYHDRVAAMTNHPIFIAASRSTVPMCIHLAVWLVWMSDVSGVKNITHGVARHLRSIGFPEGSGMGIFFALGVPLDIPDKSVLFSFYFEANYALPGEWNSTYYLDEPYLKKRSMDRRLAYEMLTNKLDSFGYSGESCLLKMICEVANFPLTNNGVLGNVLQVLFTPSSSRDENLPSQIIDAEYTTDCNNRYKKCPESPLTLISRYSLNDSS